MSEATNKTVSTDEFLALNKYDVDEDNAHIVLVDSPNIEDFEKLVNICPAGLYGIDEGGKTTFDYAGCLECGTCRIACGDTIVEFWSYPQNGKGVIYRYG